MTSKASAAVKRPSAKTSVKKSVKSPTFLGQVASALAGYLNSDVKSNLVEAILADHKALKDLLKLLKDAETPIDQKRSAFAQFKTLLQSHSVAEEKALYALSSRMRGSELKTEEGVIEHEVANDLVAKIRTPRAGSASRATVRRWEAQVQVLAELVEHHLEEEESDLLPRVRRTISAKLQAEGAQKFIRLRQASQRAPRARNGGVLRAVAAKS